MEPRQPLVIAFIYDSFSHYRSLGFSVEDCLEFDSDESIESTIQSMRACGHEVVPISGIKQLVKCIADEQHKSWDLAFSMAEGMYGAGREAQVPGLLEAYEVPHVFSDAATTALCHDKGRTKIILEHFGIPTAPFAIIPASWPDNDDASLTQLIENSPYAQALKEYPLFIKPACEGSSKGIYSFSKVESFDDFLTGPEYSVSIVGTGRSARVIGTARLDWVTPGSELYHILDRETGAELDYPCSVVDEHTDPLTQRLETLALQTWRALELRDLGRVDMRFDLNGKLYVLEVNAIPGMRPNWSTLPRTAEHRGMNHQQLIAAMLDSAIQLYPHLRGGK
ncbi:hypothetical protein BJX61DRAFT_547193 [Aspergillus egyptiacus]|nr:hypothetical protein BJX61DRAFT_547193 [Aspergillus egyptiacus]